MNDYLSIIQNIRESNDAFVILDNVDNLKFLMEKDIYFRNRQIRKLRAKNIKYYKNIARCLESV